MQRTRKGTSKVHMRSNQSTAAETQLVQADIALQRRASTKGRPRETAEQSSGREQKTSATINADTIYSLTAVLYLQSAFCVASTNTIGDKHRRITREAPSNTHKLNGQHKPTLSLVLNIVPKCPLHINERINERDQIKDAIY